MVIYASFKLWPNRTVSAHNLITLFYGRRFDAGHSVNLYICEFIKRVIDKQMLPDPSARSINDARRDCVHCVYIIFRGRNGRAGLIENNERGGRV